MADDSGALLAATLDAVDRQDWTSVRALAREVLDRDLSNTDAQAYLRVAEHRLRLAPEAAAGTLDSAETAAAEVPSGMESLGGGVFVGRAAEMARLRAALEGALSGAGRVAMLVGEPGAGKTRSAEELSTYARLREARVLWGRVHEEPGAPPGVIARIVPELRDRLPGIEAEPDLGDPQAERFRFFDSVATFLKTAAAAAPILLVLDNLHWADESSLKLLEFLAHEIGASRILVLGTYRDMELTRAHPLSRTLAELTRSRAFERFPLRGLAETDVGHLIEQASGTAPPPALARAVHAHTEGNPLFVTEVIRLLAQEGRLSPDGRRGHESWSMQIPEGVREVIGRRLDRLSAECNRVLTAASVAGRELGVDLVARLVEASHEDRVVAALEEACAARLLEELPGVLGRFRFSHKLVQETLAAELTTTQRVQMHARIVETLEALYGERAEEHAAEIAAHCAEAQLVLGTERLVRYSLVAGKQATESGAWEEAWAIYRRAIDAKGEDVVDDELVRIYEDVAPLVFLTSHVDWALRAIEKVVRHAEQSRDTRLGLQYAVALWTCAAHVRREAPIPVREHARRTLAAVDSEAKLDPWALADFGHLRWLTDGDFRAFEKCCGRAFTRAEERRDLAAQKHILSNWGFVAGATGRLRTAIEIDERLTAIEPGEQSLTERMPRHGAHADYHVRLGDAVAARAHLGAYAEIAERVRMPRWRANTCMVTQDFALAVGDWTAAREQCAKALELLSGPDWKPTDACWLLGRGALVEHELGETAAGDAYLERLAELLRRPDTPRSPVIRCASRPSSPRSRGSLVLRAGWTSRLTRRRPRSTEPSSFTTQSRISVSWPWLVATQRRPVASTTSSSSGRKTTAAGSHAPPASWPSPPATSTSPSPTSTSPTPSPGTRATARSTPGAAATWPTRSSPAARTRTPSAPSSSWRRGEASRGSSA